MEEESTTGIGEAQIPIRDDMHVRAVDSLSGRKSLWVPGRGYNDEVEVKAD